MKMAVKSMAIMITTIVSMCNAQTLSEDFKITSFDGHSLDQFGISIAISNRIVAVGSHQDDDNGLNSGSVYLYDIFTGKQLFKLLANDGAIHDNFGRHIAIDDGMVVVFGSNAVYLFDASTGIQISKLLVSGARAVAIDNGIVVIGAPRTDGGNGSLSGSVYLFDVLTGMQISRLIALEGSQGDLFGHSVAIENGVVAIGAVQDDDNGIDTGSAYLFDASTGTELFRLLAKDREAGDQFGVSISIDNGIVAIGASFDDDQGDFSGSAYLFDVSTGKQILKILPSDGAERVFFGGSIVVNNGNVAVGAYGNNGSAYLFNVSTGNQIAKLLASDGSDGDSFGISIDMDNGVVAIGAYRDDDDGTESGSAYLFSVPARCAADITGDGELDFKDVSAFLGSFLNEDPVADFNFDHEFNFFDVSAFLSAFATGCP